jgi:hypothetical protein
MDLCCFNRPFDDLSQDRIYLEADTDRVDVFLTTDDRLLRMAKKLNLTIKIDNPVFWLMEVMNNEQ